MKQVVVVSPAEFLAEQAYLPSSSGYTSRICSLQSEPIVLIRMSCTEQSTTQPADKPWEWVTGLWRNVWLMCLWISVSYSQKLKQSSFQQHWVRPRDRILSNWTLMFQKPWRVTSRWTNTVLSRYTFTTLLKYKTITKSDLQTQRERDWDTARKRGADRQ